LILHSRLLAGRLTAHLKGGWPGARVGKIENAFSYHLQGANGTDKPEVDDITYHAAKFKENVRNPTPVRSQIRSGKFSCTTL
jgi:hypothetical protein